MRTERLILTFLLTPFLLQAQLSFKGDIERLLVDFDPSFMKKYEYVTDENYIVEESHINYHIPLTVENTLILKIPNSQKPVNHTNYTKMKRQDLMMVDYDLVERVNNKGTLMFLNINGKVYEAAYIIYRKMTDKQMVYYAPPFLSFYFDYDKQHDPGQNIYVEGSDEIDYIVRHYYHGSTTVEGIQNDVLLKMYKDACYNRDFGITTPLSEVGAPNPYLSEPSKVLGKPIFRSCQHPIQSEYLRGIGLYKEFYNEGSTVYKSELVAIDNIPIQQYLKLAKEGIQFATLQNSNGFAARGGDITRGSVAKKAVPNEYSTIKTPVQAFSRKQSVKAENPNKKVTTAAVPNNRLTIGPKETHTVQAGETIYRISRQYNLTVEELKSMNNLRDNTILTNQKLIIRRQ